MLLLEDTKVEVQYNNGGVSMERIPNAVYTKELREDAVKLVTEQGLTIADVGRRLSIPKSTISYWVREERKGKLSCVGSSKKSLTETEMELAKIPVAFKRSAISCFCPPRSSSRATLPPPRCENIRVARVYVFSICHFVSPGSFIFSGSQPSGLNSAI